MEDKKQRNKGRKNGKKIDRPPVNNGKTDSDKRFKNLEKMIEKLQASMKPQSEHLATEKINDTISSDSNAFIVQEEAIYSADDGNKIYLDSGAGIKIIPVYYAPSGPVNLLSVSQLLDHGIQPVIKNDCFLLKKEQTIVAAFKREGNLFVSKIEVNKTFFTSNNDRDWHAILGHPSNRYLKHLMTTNQIKGKILLSRNCESGDFTSHRSGDQGIVLEWGLPESPQTNGVAEHSNENLCSKIQCLLAQSRIPIQMWTEDAKHSSLLLNLLPHRAINMKSPQKLLEKTKINIEKGINLNSLIPFGMKTTVHLKNSKSKLDPRGETLKALTYESYSDDLDNQPTAVLEHENHEIPIDTHEAVSHNLTEEAEVQVKGNPSLGTHKHYEYVTY
ncbi:hypothetical protein O181_001427 [Austropuccinia psidii MF-1]|uniref:GAG-pre-integrase domain-containing protein n=1 Tax=Austropuccinia psidii MF-1 TaxID=1389203 RepID=A0A9Q3GD12_9BASI|nr:hypothetical protein [Austropuccinia psidii MF-1]